jgi:hypothetical protein
MVGVVLVLGAAEGEAVPRTIPKATTSNEDQRRWPKLLGSRKRGISGQTLRGIKVKAKSWNFGEKIIINSCLGKKRRREREQRVRSKKWVENGGSRTLAGK